MAAIQGICMKLFRNNGMALIHHENGYAVAELFDEDINHGDLLFGDWDDLGSCYIRNLEQKTRFEVYMQGNWGSAEAALRANGY